MLRFRWTYSLFSLVLAACNGTGQIEAESGAQDKVTPDRELIVVAAPRSTDSYYAEAFEDIRAFHVAYAKTVLPYDDFIVLTGRDSYTYYAEAIGAKHVLLAPQADIWARDFSPSLPSSPMLFRYTAEGQGGGREGLEEATFVQAKFARLLAKAGLVFNTVNWLNDGGNLVDDDRGRAVLSRKFLRDNGIAESQARKILSETLDLKAVAFIESDEQGGLEHADGVVAFIEPNVLVMNSYPEDPAYAAELKADLRAGLPGLTLHELVTAYDGAQIYDDSFGSACGLYTNMLVTPDRIYLPQFGIAEDALALTQIRQWTQKQVIPVRSEGVCYMGGGVRCMSWQVRGQNAAKLKALAARP